MKNTDEGLTEALAAIARMSRAELLADGSATVQVTSREYGVSRSRLYELMSLGLPFSQVGGRRLIPRRAVRELLAKMMVGGSVAGAGA